MWNGGTNRTTDPHNSARSPRYNFRIGRESRWTIRIGQ